jgi:hypothetical protein
LKSASCGLRGATTFQIQFTLSSNGLKTAKVWKSNNDGNENPYNFVIQGTGLIAYLEMDVLGNQVVHFYSTVYTQMRRFHSVTVWMRKCENSAKVVAIWLYL